MTIQINRLVPCCITTASSSHTQFKPSPHPLLDSLEKIPLDDDSDCTVSTTRSYSSEEEEDEYDEDRVPRRRAVSFSKILVSQIWTRPRTPTEDVAKLFYTAEETQRFRQEYRLERKKSTEGSSYGSSLSLWWVPQDFSTATTTTTNVTTKASSSFSSSSSSPRRNHHIHRVVVLHQNVQHTFVEAPFILKNHNHNDYNKKKEELLESEDPSKASATDATNTTVDTTAFRYDAANYTVTNATTDTVAMDTANTTEPTPFHAVTSGIGMDTSCTYAYQDFFDCDSFWSGQITWY